LAAIAAAGVALAAAPAASAQTPSLFYIHGGGNGHGIGMSQYGAYGFAQHGRSHEWILGHYYQGTKLGTTNPDQTVTVLLATGSASFSGASRAGSVALAPGDTYYVKALPSGQLRIVTGAGKRVGPKKLSAPLTVTGPGPLTVPGLGSYHGSLVLTPDGSGGVQAVNAVALDDYVRGVVAAEMPSRWSMQALEAQAVAARTYAITTSVDGSGFGLYDDTRSQMYGGVGAETASTDAAVAATSGEIVTYHGSPAVTYFFSSSGGYTESVQNVWPGATPEPWLRGVPDPYDRAGHDPYHRWTYRMTLAAAQARLGSLVKGRLIGIRIAKRGVSPRVITASVVATKGATSVSGASLARIFNLPATYMSFTTITAGSAKGSLTGSVYPASARAQLSVQSWTGHSWRRLSGSSLGRHGGYRANLSHTGRYRIAVGGLGGPAIRVHVPRPPRPPLTAATAAAASVLTGKLPPWVNDYAGKRAWPTAGDRRTVRSVPLLLRAP
jgi:stage II sporulation protein D